MYNLYLTEDDMIESTQFPAIALFNEASNQNVVEFFRNLSKGVGEGYNYTVCYFWDELDEYDQSSVIPFEGLCIETEDNEQVILPYEHVYRYMKLLATRYSETENDSALYENLNDSIEKFAKKYLTK